MPILQYNNMKIFIQRNSIFLFMYVFGQTMF